MERTTDLPRYRHIRDALEAKITAGELAPGDRLPTERALENEFAAHRSVVRHALAGLARDGLIGAQPRRGWHVIGPRIPWISRLRPLCDQPTSTVIELVQTAIADARTAAALAIAAGSQVAERHSTLTAAGETWGIGVSRYPLGTPPRGGDPTVLLNPGEIHYDDLERAFDRSITGFRERLRARTPTSRERERLAITDHTPVLEVERVARTSLGPISHFLFACRADRFEADYTIAP